jgi:HEAT repeat protein
MQTTGQNTPAQPPQASRPTPGLWLKTPPELQAERLDSLSPADLTKILKDPKSSDFEKAKSCQRLAVVGTPEAVPALAALLTDEHLGVYARFGLEPIKHPSVDNALRNALSRAKGGPLVGVINSIRYRKDTRAVPALVKLLSSDDPFVAEAAAWALGTISGPESAKALQDGLGKTKGPVRMAVAGAGLTCAEGLLAQGQRSLALSLYDALSRNDIPKPVRLAAMHGTIAAEISLSRPR